MTLLLRGKKIVWRVGIEGYLGLFLDVECRIASFSDENCFKMRKAGIRRALTRRFEFSAQFDTHHPPDE